jgi:hypothetical protein
MTIILGDYFTKLKPIFKKKSFIWALNIIIPNIIGNLLICFLTIALCLQFAPAARFASGTVKDRDARRSGVYSCYATAFLGKDQLPDNTSRLAFFFSTNVSTR